MESNISYIYAKKDTLSIFKIAHHSDESLHDDYHQIEIDREFGIKLIEGPHKLLSYMVFFDGIKAHLIEKEKIQNKLLLHYTPEIIKEVSEPQDLTFFIEEEKITIALKPELALYTAQFLAGLTKEKQITNLYISAKNNPNKLLKIIKFNLADLTKHPFKVDINFKYKDDTSMFMKKYYNTCGFIKNVS